ncbi:ATP-binding protein [Rathayibacter sp. VKM Ac-2760]|uniref:sensor histidine kinase n=1 Tax=Rathayibacter sp. VKM Ac-2760 TaxID=2609253 RepID=UPI001318C335|nr:ATP-binding protein [Rathayibacter sp. VKM Ac-2760]QHC59994.1 hypothetical protein GSU72_16640 [Rathayibacter sp. VKM Ac-2760]
MSPATLRAQAEADLALLRRLDRAEPEPAPASAAGSRVPAVLAEVGRRAQALGVEVHWHLGSWRDVPPAPALDALARATGECLENVRRHSGVAAAHVSLDGDEDSARVAVSDAGRGFDPATAPEGRLGLAESVVGRIEAVGGTVRIFSATGAGTTVLMSVPR